MIDVLIVDDKDFELIQEFIEQKGSVLKGNCKVSFTPFATMIPNAKSNFHDISEIATEKIKTLKNIDLAFLDISFPDEEKKEYEALQVIIDTIKIYHKNCQIIITSHYQTAPQAMLEYEVNNAKYLSISKAIDRVNIIEYNKVFKIALSNWSKLQLISITTAKQQIEIIKAVELGNTKLTIGTKQLHDLIFFIDTIGAQIQFLLGNFVQFPKIEASKLNYQFITPEELFIEFYLKRIEKYNSNKTIEMMGDIIYRLINNDYIRYKIGENNFENLLKNNVGLPEAQKEDYKLFFFNNDVIRNYTNLSGPPYLYITSNFNFQKDRYNNISNDAIDTFEKILYQRILTFFMFFSMHLNMGVIYNLLSNLSFTPSDSSEVKQFPTQVLLIKGFDPRSFAVLDDKNKHDDVRFKMFYKVIRQLASFERELILKITDKIIYLLNQSNMAEIHAKSRLEQIFRLLSSYSQDTNE